MALLVFLAAAPAKGPAPADTARLFFLAGDLAKAADWANRGVKDDPKRCRPLVRALAEYAFLANHTDEFTPSQARDFIEWDKAISPGTPGKITQPVIDRFVNAPLKKAEALKESDKAQAKEITAHVLEVDPGNAEARSLLRLLGARSRGHMAVPERRQ